jgi:hypothetical protein
MKDNHNSGQWLAIVDQDGIAGIGRHRSPGWYVIRTCPCHYGKTITKCYETRERAEIVMRVMLDVAVKLGASRDEGQDGECPGFGVPRITPSAGGVVSSRISPLLATGNPDE